MEAIMKIRNAAKIFILLLLTLILALPSFAVNTCTDTVFYSSNDPENYVRFTIDGNEMIVDGIIPVEGLNRVLICTSDTVDFDVFTQVIQAKPGEYFKKRMPLKTSLDSSTIRIFIGTENSGDKFIGFINDEVIIESSGDSYRFSVSPELNNNLEWNAKWADPKDFLIPDDLSTLDGDSALLLISYDKLTTVNENKTAFVNAISDAITRLRKKGNEIVAGAENDYEKARLLSEWVSKNIYYDKDFTSGKTDKVYFYPLEVLEKRYTICEGYARLLNAYLLTQNIPSMIVRTYSLGVDTAGSHFTGDENIVETNHAHVSAYIDGRWVTMDPTWDSLMEYSDGKFLDGYSISSYFDITDERLAWTHKIMYRPTSAESTQTVTDNPPKQQDAPSDWAEKEVNSAIGYGLVPDDLRCDYREKITREKFCRLVMNMLVKYTGAADIDGLLAKAGKTVDSGMFSDTNDPSVLAAATLGIVNGTGDGKFSPNGSLTREQAATMLSRAANVLGIKSTGSAVTFADEDGISGWAVDSVRFISTLVSSEDSKVMGGVGDNKFSPKGSYTTEQSILTVYRMFMCK